VLADPAAAQAKYAHLLEAYLERVFAVEAAVVAEAAARAASAALELLGVLPTVEAIERLTGGYTLGDDLALRRVTLAPSVFIYPFMSSRVDERAGEALILYGVRTDLFRKYDPVPLDPGLVRALKALADPGRLKVMLLLGKSPMFGPELIAALGLAQPTVHHHLAQLRAAGLIRQERAKGGMRYSVRRDSAGATIKTLERLIAGRD
jgi:DNA-binding transcriptional ArsR family regulator